MTIYAAFLISGLIIGVVIGVGACAVVRLKIVHG